MKLTRFDKTFETIFDASVVSSCRFNGDSFYAMAYQLTIGQGNNQRRIELSVQELCMLRELLKDLVI
jgi:hypothetical protein